MSSSAAITWWTYRKFARSRLLRCRTRYTTKPSAPALPQFTHRQTHRHHTSSSEVLIIVHGLPFPGDPLAESGRGR